VRTWIAVALLLGSADALSGKGMGVGVHVRGTISGVRTRGEAVEFQVSGSLELAQYRGQKRSAIWLESRTPIRVVGRQTSFCFVMIDDWSWNPGPCRAGQIRELLDRAAREKRALKVELGDAVVHFVGESAEVVGSSIIRVFDDDQRRESSSGEVPQDSNKRRIR
jgi:hypothetical protein